METDHKELQLSLQLGAVWVYAIRWSATKLWAVQLCISSVLCQIYFKASTEALFFCLFFLNIHKHRTQMLGLLWRTRSHPMKSPTPWYTQLICPNRFQHESWMMHGEQVTQILSSQLVQAHAHTHKWRLRLTQYMLIYYDTACEVRKLCSLCNSFSDILHRSELHISSLHVAKACAGWCVVSYLR